MSTMAYATLTARREETPPPVAGSSSAGRAVGVTRVPAVSTYVDAMSALVPAEVLAFHAIMVGISTQTGRAPATGAAGVTSASGPVTTITNPDALVYTFWVLIGLSIALYLVPHYVTGNRRFERWDSIRMLLAPLAFTAWTMLQRATAFDAVAPGVDSAVRTLIGLVLATVVGFTASVLARKADLQEPA